MIKEIVRLAKGNYTPKERYILGETTFYNRKIKEKKAGIVEKLEVENLFLRKEKQRLYVRNILSS